MTGAARYAVCAVVVVLLLAASAQAASAPDAGRAFEPRPLSEPLDGFGRRPS